jgi:hypothetical protein
MGNPLETAVSSRFWRFSLVLFPYELEKYPYFHFTTRYIFVGFAAMAWAALLPFVQCMENRDLFSGPVVALVQ